MANDNEKRATPVTPDPELVEMVRSTLEQALSYHLAKVFYSADGKSALIYDGRDRMFQLDADGNMWDKSY